MFPSNFTLLIAPGRNRFTSGLVEKSFEYTIPYNGTTSVIRIAFLKNGRMMADVVLVRGEQQANPVGV